jgi:Predicted phosphoribosyltransferases
VKGHTVIGEIGIAPLHAREVIVAVPVAAKETCRELRAEVDDIICLRTPPASQAAGLWYDDFSQTCDKEVRTLLDRS